MQRIVQAINVPGDKFERRDRHSLRRKL